MSDIGRILLDCCSKAVAAGARFADARATRSSGLSVSIQDGRAEKLFSHTAQGAGVRVLFDGAWGFASADSLDEAAIERARRSAQDAARLAAPTCRDKAAVAPVTAATAKHEVKVRRSFDDWPLEQTLGRLLELERAGQAAADPHCLNSLLSFGQGSRTMWQANSFGADVRQFYPHCRISYTITAAVDEVRQQTTEVKAALGGLELLADLAPEQLSVKAARKVLRQCRARLAPSGAMPVVFHPSLTGLLAHEALGHNAEADSFHAGQSVLLGKLGQQIAAPGVTIVDDSTLAGGYGSFGFDDEGVPAQRRMLVENGVFKSLLHNLETAWRFGVPPNGSGRAEDHAGQPLARMSNTFVVPNPAGPPLEEMIRSIDRGVYLANGHEGYVFPERGQFVCKADSARLIEHGQLGEWLRDVSVSGLLVETLLRIDLVGPDFEMAMPGVCGKMGQGVLTDCGGPHLRVSRMVVGGR